MRYELNNDGEIVRYEGKVQLPSNPEKILVDLFSQESYECIVLEKNGLVFKLQITDSSKINSFQLWVYYGNVRNESRNKKEKKIQLNTKDPRGKKNAIILGVYGFNSDNKLNNLLISAWNVDNDMNYPSNPSIRGINIDLFQEAKNEGIAFNKYRNNTVTVFKPEQIFNYLFNIRGIVKTTQSPFISQLNNQLNKNNWAEAINDNIAEYQMMARKIRKGQPKFRKNLIELYSGKCAISECAVKEVLEAAHIIKHSKYGINHSSNGILLRSDIHSLFDINKIKINPTNYKIEVDNSLKNSDYYEYHNRQIRSKKDGTFPKEEYLYIKYGNQFL